MNQKEFLDKMELILDCDREISMDDMLSDFEEWDSLSVVSFLGLVKTNTNKTMETDTVRQAKTIYDLFCLLENGHLK